MRSSGLILALTLTLGLAVLVLPVVLQIWLSKRSRWLGLILPALSFLISASLVLGSMAFTRTATMMTEDGVVVSSYTETTPGALGAGAAVFLLYNIPTVVHLGIWGYFEGKRRRDSALEKMSIQDLE